VPSSGRKNGKRGKRIATAEDAAGPMLKRRGWGGNGGEKVSSSTPGAQKARKGKRNRRCQLLKRKILRPKTCSRGSVLAGMVKKVSLRELHQKEKAREKQKEDRFKKWKQSAPKGLLDFRGKLLSWGGGGGGGGGWGFWGGGGWGFFFFWGGGLGGWLVFLWGLFFWEIGGGGGVGVFFGGFVGGTHKMFWGLFGGVWFVWGFVLGLCLVVFFVLGGGGGN